MHMRDANLCRYKTLKQHYERIITSVKIKP